MPVNKETTHNQSYHVTEYKETKDFLLLSFTNRFFLSNVKAADSAISKFLSNICFAGVAI